MKIILSIILAFIMFCNFGFSSKKNAITKNEVSYFVNWFLQNEVNNQDKTNLFKYSSDIREYQFLHNYDLNEIFNIKPDSTTVRIICVEPIRFEKSPLNALLALDNSLDTTFIMIQIRNEDNYSRLWQDYDIHSAKIVGRNPISILRANKTRFISRPVFSSDRQFVILQTTLLNRRNIPIEKEKILIYKRQNDGWKLLDKINRKN